MDITENSEEFSDNNMDTEIDMDSINQESMDLDNMANFLHSESLEF